MMAAGRGLRHRQYEAYLVGLVRSELCAFCGREFRGISPTRVRQRHESEHRFAAIARAATS